MFSTIKDNSLHNVVFMPLGQLTEVSSGFNSLTLLVVVSVILLAFLAGWESGIDTIPQTRQAQHQPTSLHTTGYGRFGEVPAFYRQWAGGVR